MEQSVPDRLFVPNLHIRWVYFTLSEAQEETTTTEETEPIGHTPYNSISFGDNDDYNLEQNIDWTSPHIYAITTGRDSGVDFYVSFRDHAEI